MNMSKTEYQALNGKLNENPNYYGDSSRKIEIALVYRCDTWHTRPSFVLLGVALDFIQVLELIGQSIKADGDEPMHGEALEQLRSMKQTQNYKGEGEFIVEGAITGVLI